MHAKTQTLKLQITSGANRLTYLREAPCDPS